MPFEVPTSQIKNKHDLKIFQQSSAYTEIVDFVLRLNESVIKKPNSTECYISENVEKILAILSSLEELIKETPPLPTRSRFGNKAFCTYFDKVEQNLNILMRKVLPESLYEAEIEIGPYFLHSLGNKQRIDYGSGHELNFVVWLMCLEKIGLLKPEDYTTLVLRVFTRYLDVMRLAQKEYWLEPAGSHGVWGLDDYQFLPFLWGSAQLIDHKYIRPRSITNTDIIDGFSNDYIYLGCIKFIMQVKSGSFFEHSPLLFDISGAKSWNKVNEGMIKMFKSEVLSKLPIISHFMFGTIISFHNDHDNHNDDSCCNTSTNDNHDHHGHNDDTSNDDNGKYRVKSCCVQRIPSTFAARAISDISSTGSASNIK